MFINSSRLLSLRFPRSKFKFTFELELLPSLLHFKQTLCAASSFVLLQRTFPLFNMSPHHTFFPLSAIYPPLPSLLSPCIYSTRSCFQRQSYFSVCVGLLLLVQSISNSGCLSSLLDIIFIGYHLRRPFRKRLWIIEIERCLCRTPYSSPPVFSWLLVFVSGSNQLVLVSGSNQLVFVSGQSCSLSNLFWSPCSL